MHKMTTGKVLMLVFGLMGALFLVMGLVFLSSVSILTPAGDAAFQGAAPGLAFGIVGGVFALIGAGFLLAALLIGLSARRKVRQQYELRTWGTRTTGVVTDIPVDHTLVVNGRSPLRIMVQVLHPITGEHMTLRSPQVWETSLSCGDAVDVCFDPMDEKKYLIDLPESTGR
ncbi:MAG: hypothetical protein IJZ74_04330 [Clostridia bacterium]|nr:hypothetical protein [Clostridia bacterium]